jgi:hypothetical protein
MMKYISLIALSALVVGCGDKGDSGDTSGGGSEGTDGATGGGDGSSGAELTFGLAETGAGADGWYGEDCSTGDYCHPAGTAGVTLSSVHPDVGGAGLDAVESGVTTLLWAGLDASITYVVIDGDTTECWAWGNEPGYYTTCSAI